MNIKYYSTLHLDVDKNKSFFFIKDPIHGYINFSKDQFWIYELINTPEFQRLSRIKQLGWTYQNFPGATHTRLVHSLGTYELCNRFLTHFINENMLDESNRTEINIALASALLHDIGHGPYSHSFENAFLFNHEDMTTKVISSSDTKINFLLKKKALEDGLEESFYVDGICAVLNKNTPHKWISDMLSSEIDVDRLDYIERDRYFSGVNYSFVDHKLLIKWSALHSIEGKKRFLFLDKAKYHIFNFLESRQYMFLDLYENRRSQIYEELFLFICQLFKNNFDSLSNDPFYEKYRFLSEKPETWSVPDWISLDDEVIDILFRYLSEDEDALLRSICNLFLGNQHMSNHNIVLYEDKRKHQMELFLKQNNCVLNKQVYFANHNKTYNITFLDKDQNSINKETLDITKELHKPLYMSIISNNQYLEWIKYIK